MSAFNEVDVECAQCGDKFKGTVWTAIHAKEDPELKEMLMGGEINMLFCPQCSHTFFYEHFLLYQDPRLSLVAYVYPPSEEEQAADLEKMMKQSYKDAQETFDRKDRLNFEPVLLFGLDQLQERIRIEEDRVLKEEVEKAKKKVND